MESPRKFNDCYFYYYSTCTKGDNCVFRHEPSALGCETMCTAWQQGKCLDKRCKLRHMELRKNRKQIPCYWENQPGGCRKIHCPFMHKNPEARTDGIAPSQPIPMPMPGMPINESVVSAEPPMSAVTPAPVPAPVPLLWQQQRQDHLPPVVLDSSMLGVLPASSELRRMLTPHPHPHAHPHPHPHDAPNPYGAMPVDPLVVNFEEESDNESAPSSTPTKCEDGSQSHELLILERIQAESAAYYNYDALPIDAPNERKLVRANPAAKYDKVSLDEIAGKKQPQEQRNLDFKILSLDEIRARKTKSDTLLAIPPITLNLRKRKLSTQETVTTSGNKILKVVRSKSIVYKKFEQNAPATSTQAKLGRKRSDSESRKRTFSEQSDACELHADELEDNCYEFKRIKVNEQSTQNKPRLIRNRNTSENKDNEDSVITETIISNADNDSDNEVQIVRVDISNDLSLDKIYDSDIEVEPLKPIEIVDSDDEENGEITVGDLDLDLVKNVPDVVASCQISNTNKDNDRNVISEIDDILNDNL